MFKKANMKIMQWPFGDFGDNRVLFYFIYLFFVWYEFVSSSCW